MHDYTIFHLDSGLLRVTAILLYQIGLEKYNCLLISGIDSWLTSLISTNVQSIHGAWMYKLFHIYIHTWVGRIHLLEKKIKSQSKGLWTKTHNESKSSFAYLNQNGNTQCVSKTEVIIQEQSNHVLFLQNSRHLYLIDGAQSKVIVSWIIEFLIVLSQREIVSYRKTFDIASVSFIFKIAFHLEIIHSQKLIYYE